MNRVFYTDGSAKSNGSINSSGGWGIVEINIDTNEIIWQAQGFKAPTTNNEMELMAILKAFEHIKLEGVLGMTTIYTDSAYCYNLTNDWMYRWANNNWTRGAKHEEIKNLNLIKQIYELASLAYVEKVQGHSNNEWNNYADKLATGKINLEGGNGIGR